MDKVGFDTGHNDVPWLTMRVRFSWLSRWFAFCLVGLGSVFFLVCCGHICMAGHMHHPPYTIWDVYADGMWVIFLGTGTFFSLWVRGRRHYACVGALLIVTASRLLMESGGGGNMLLEVPLLMATLLLLSQADSSKFFVVRHCLMPTLWMLIYSLSCLIYPKFVLLLVSEQESRVRLVSGLFDWHWLVVFAVSVMIFELASLVIRLVRKALPARASDLVWILAEEE